MEQKLYDAAARLPETELEFDAIQAVPRLAKAGTKRPWRRIAPLAACLLLLISIGLGSYAYAAEVQEYNSAVRFFGDHGLSTEGLSRGEIKAVYRDITTRSFTYSKTAEVIQKSLSNDSVGGFEIFQEQPTPEEIENLWDCKNYNGRYWVANQDHDDAIRYSYDYILKRDDPMGSAVVDKSFFEKYEGDKLLWCVTLPEFQIWDYQVVSDGVIVYGYTDRWSSEQPTYPLLAKIDADGQLLWTYKGVNGFRAEYIQAVVENADGSYGVFSMGDDSYFCFSRYQADGTLICFQKTDIGEQSIRAVARFGDGYIVQLDGYKGNEPTNIVKVDSDGNITESFSYTSEDASYYISDMIEFDGNMYLSAYAVPKAAEDGSDGIRNEVADLLNRLFGPGKRITNQELTLRLRKQYTAILFVCDSKTGTPLEFYSVPGSLGGRLSLSDSGELLWDVESISSAFFSPITSSFTIGGTCCIFQYTFDETGALIRQEKTGEVTDFRR